MDALGTPSMDFANLQLVVLERACGGAGDGKDDVAVNAALAMIQAIGPKDELEAALAVQMAAAHALSLKAAGWANRTENIVAATAGGNLSVKMMRTFTAQIEALARLRGKGQQTVRVEHVTVQPGAHATAGRVVRDLRRGRAQLGSSCPLLTVRRHGRASAPPIRRSEMAKPLDDRILAAMGHGARAATVSDLINEVAAAIDVAQIEHDALDARSKSATSPEDEAEAAAEEAGRVARRLVRLQATRRSSTRRAPGWFLGKWSSIAVHASSDSQNNERDIPKASSSAKTP